MDKQPTTKAAALFRISAFKFGFVDFTEADGVGNEAFASFDFDEVFSVLPAIVEGESDGVFVVDERP